jgi:DNA-binding MarR family transcriptional regulator
VLNRRVQRVLDYIIDLYYIVGMNPPIPKSPPPLLQHSGRESHLFKEIMLTSHGMQMVIPRLTGMPVARFTLLRLIALSQPESLGPMELARRLGVNAAAITRQLADMERVGLIERLGDPEDARRSRVQLTRGGFAAFEQIHARMHHFEASLRASLSEEEIATAVHVLTVLRETFSHIVKGEE